MRFQQTVCSFISRNSMLLNRRHLLSRRCTDRHTHKIYKRNKYSWSASVLAAKCYPPLTVCCWNPSRFTMYFFWRSTDEVHRKEQKWYLWYLTTPGTLRTETATLQLTQTVSSPLMEGKFGYFLQLCSTSHFICISISRLANKKQGDLSLLSASWGKFLTRLLCCSAICVTWKLAGK